MDSFKQKEELDFLSKKRLELEKLQSELNNIKGIQDQVKTEQEPVQQVQSFQSVQQPLQQTKQFIAVQQPIQQTKSFQPSSQNTSQTNIQLLKQVQFKPQQQQQAAAQIHVTKRPQQNPPIIQKNQVKPTTTGPRSCSVKNQKQTQGKFQSVYNQGNQTPTMRNQIAKTITQEQQKSKNQLTKNVQKIPVNFDQFYKKGIVRRRPSQNSVNLNLSMSDTKDSKFQDFKQRSATPQSNLYARKIQESEYEFQDHGNYFQELCDSVGTNLANEYKRLFNKNAGANSYKLNLMQFRKFIKENQLVHKNQGSIDLLFYKFSSQSNCLDFQKFMNFIQFLSDQKFKKEKVQTIRLQRLLQENLFKQRAYSPRTIELQKVYTELYQPSIQDKVETNKNKIQMIYQQITKKIDCYDVQQPDVLHFFKTLKVIPDFISQSQLIKLYTTLSNPMFQYNQNITLLETMIYIIAYQSYSKVFTNTKLQSKGEKYDQFVDRMGKQFISYSRKRS